MPRRFLLDSTFTQNFIRENLPYLFVFVETFVTKTVCRYPSATSLPDKCDGRVRLVVQRQASK